MIKYVAFGDVHSCEEYIDLVIKFIKKEKPNYVIIGGDLLDFYAISKFNTRKRNSKGINWCIEETNKELKIGNRILDKIDKASPKSKRVFIMGNHEERLDKFYLEYPQISESDIRKELKLDERGYEFVDVGDYYKLGKLYFIHGDGYQVDNFTKKVAVSCRKNVRLFHNHTNQSYMITSPIGSEDKTEVKSAGCLCPNDPEYMKGIRNRWINSFFFGYVLDNGDFQDYTINIINKRIITPKGEIIK